MTVRKMQALESEFIGKKIKKLVMTEHELFLQTEDGLVIQADAFPADAFGCELFKTEEDYVLYEFVKEENENATSNAKTR